MRRKPANDKRVNYRRAHIAAAVAMTLSMVAEGAQGASIDTGNSDVEVRWDNTIRYSAGLRAQDRDARIANNAAYDQGDFQFNKHELINNRIDLLSEFDISYKRTYGLRVSAAAWYDAAYSNNSSSNPALPAHSSYQNNEFTSYVKRYYSGPSGEILDAFAYGRIDAGDVPINIKVGRHAVIWGESLFGSTNAISYSQTPSDGLKALSSPAASAKETALPISQISSSAQISDTVTVAAQYLFEWRPNRIAEGGTFFAGSNSILFGPNVGRASPIEGRAGDYGINLRWAPEFMGDGTFGLVYRRFDEKTAWVAQFDPTVGLSRAVYARGIELYGLSMSKNIGGIAVGAELSYRKNGALNSRGATGPLLEGARGNTYHAVLNGVATYGQTGLFDSASLSAELSVSHLDKVTSNAQLYRSVGNVAAGCPDDDIMRGCATNTAMSFSAQFTPVWNQVLPGVDMELPLFFSSNFKGNSPYNSGGSEGFNTYKIGLTAKVDARYQFDLAYTGYQVKSRDGIPSATSNNSTILGAPYGDKGWFSFTFQTTF